MIIRDDVTAWLDSLFTPEKMADRSLNGLQVYGQDAVTGIALGVDACMELFNQAAELGTNYVIVHHGFLWVHPSRLRRCGGRATGRCWITACPCMHVIFPWTPTPRWGTTR